MGIVWANVAMILFGWIQETSNPPGQTVTRMIPFWFGTIAGLAPWMAITINLQVDGSNVSGFAYGIFVSLFVLFMSFGLNQLRTPSKKRYIRDQTHLPTPRTR